VKRAVRVLLVLALLLLIAGWGARRYLRSRHVAERVAAHLEAVYGGSLRVAEVDVGLDGTSLSGFEVFEKDCPTTDTPWLVIESIQTDLSILDVLRGRAMPSKIKVAGAKVLLQFDRDGRQVTCLPTAFPDNIDAHAEDAGELSEIELANCRIVFRRPGSEDFIVDNIQARISKEGRGLALVGSADNPAWGQWTLSGQYTADASPISIELRRETPIHLTQAMLERLPFVPDDVWREVQFARGKSDGLVRLSYDLKERRLGYRVELSPTQTSVHVAAIDLDAADARGQVIIEDDLVTLRDVQGTTLGGTLGIDADLDFRARPFRLDFTRLEALDLVVSRFPASWRFPRQITGKLRGSAALEVAVIPGRGSPASIATMVGMLSRVGLPELVRAASAFPHVGPATVQTRGSGRGKIMDAFVAGQPAAEPILLELHPVPGGFRFGNVEKTGEKASDASAALLALLTLLGVSPEAPMPALPAQEREGPNKAAGIGSSLDFDLKMKDVDLAKFAQDLEVPVPVPLAGTLSFQVKVTIPLDEARDLKRYKVQGEAQLRDFRLGDVQL
jgi:hypothetical protein